MLRNQNMIISGSRLELSGKVGTETFEGSEEEKLPKLKWIRSN